MGAAALLVAAALGGAAAEVRAAESAPGAERLLEIREFRVEGVRSLAAADVDAAVSPFLGPMRVLEDVERARLALERAYSERGYQSVTVAIPRQTVREGVVTLAVEERRIGRLRVRGSRWHGLAEIRKLAPSVAEGSVPNFNELVQDVFALNQLPDRRVTPAIRQGAIPGTIDVDLNVEDRLPLHGTLEVNDRHARDTTSLRASASLRYDNLWQLGHSLTVALQLAPERLDDARVLSASFQARLPSVPWLSLLATYLNQGSDISTLGDVGVVGRGRMMGARALLTLPSTERFFHTLSTGVDYKTFSERIYLAEHAAVLSSPVTYWPVGAQWTGFWTADGSSAQLGAEVTFALRAAGSGAEPFKAKRYEARGDFFVFRLEASGTQRLPLDFEIGIRAQGQYAPDPLVGSEQLAAGGAESVRGYLESEVAGDVGGHGGIELRGPSLAPLFRRRVVQEWRFHLFADGAWAKGHAPLAEVPGDAALASFGAGTAVRLARSANGRLRVNGRLDVGFPMRATEQSSFLAPRLHFRLATEF